MVFSMCQLDWWMGVLIVSQTVLWMYIWGTFGDEMGIWLSRLSIYSKLSYLMWSEQIRKEAPPTKKGVFLPPECFKLGYQSFSSAFRIGLNVNLCGLYNTNIQVGIYTMCSPVFQAQATQLAPGNPTHWLPILELHSLHKCLRVWPFFSLSPLSYLRAPANTHVWITVKQEVLCYQMSSLWGRTQTMSWELEWIYPRTLWEVS